MNTSQAYIYVTFLALTFFFFIFPIKLFCQDSTLRSRIDVYPLITDSLLAAEDSAVFFRFFETRKRAVDRKLELLSINEYKHSRAKNTSASVVSVYGGYSSYAMNYRSIIDTPYGEKDILQHNLSGQLNLRTANLPLQLTYLLRRSNSRIFKDIYDLQLSLDPNALRSMLREKFQRRVTALASAMDDSLSGKLISLKEQNLNFTKEWLTSPFQIQRLIEANEVLKVPGITHRTKYSNEENKSREDSLKEHAEKFISLYNKVDSIYDESYRKLQAFKSEYDAAKQMAQRFSDISNADINSYSGYADWKSQLRREDLTDVDLSKNDLRLMSIRNFSIGRSPLNHSELTAKNISINGINFEYNSWYYAAISAGLVDFRFRDFALGSGRQKQYLAMVRGGLGNLDKSFLILSLFKGRKQLFASTPANSGLTAIDINGYSAEAKWRVNKNNYLTGEVAESISPDFRNNGLITNTKFNLSDNSNKAFYIKLSTYYPHSKSRIEGAYKYTGSNYQSFSSFQTNSMLKSWYIKGDQYFFKKIGKIFASVRSNDFSNPYIIQNYKSNTIFKTLGTSFKKRGWPSLTVAYMPLSQLTLIDQTIVENKFQSLNANLYHYYNIQNTKTSSTVMYNKFFNSGADSGFVYYNATNTFFGQSIFLGTSIASLSISDTRNGQYQMQVFDESMQFSFAKNSTITTGVKINNFNKQMVKVGGYMSSSVGLWKNDILSFSFERGFLPGISGVLIKNDIGTIQFTKTFGFVKHY